MSREFRFHVWGAIAWFVVLEALLVGAILFWPSFEENIDSLKAMAPIQVLKDMVDKLGEGGVAAYVNGQHFFKGCNTVGTLAAVVFAMGTVAGEAHRGTLEMLLARPLSRRRVLTERYVSGALAVIVPVFVSSLTIPWLLGFVDEDMPVGPLLLSSTQESALLLAVYSATFLYSCASSKPIQIAFAMLLFTIFQFSIYMIKEVTHVSLFRLTDVDTFAYIGATHALEPWKFLPLVAFSVTAFVAAQFVYARRTP